MPLLIDLVDKLARFPVAYGLQPVRGWPVYHLDNVLNQSTQRLKKMALGEGPWNALLKLWADAFEIEAADYVFHSGDETDSMADAIFPGEGPHPWTAHLSARTKEGLAETSADKIFGIYETLKTPDFDDIGRQLDNVGSLIGGGDPRNYYFYKPNPANVAASEIIRWGKLPTTLVNWKAWKEWQQWNDELIWRDDTRYTPRSISLTAGGSGSLTPGVTYYVRVATEKASELSSASQHSPNRTWESITLAGGQTSFQVSWLIKNDDTDTPITDMTGYRVYIGTVEGVWLGWFHVASPAARSFLVTTIGGVAVGSPSDTATSGLLEQIKRFECMPFFIPPYNLVSSLDTICQISCAEWQWSSLGTGLYSNNMIRFMSPVGRVPVFTLDAFEVGRSSFKATPIDSRDRLNQIIVNFRDRDDSLLGEAEPVILDRELLQESDGVIRSMTIEMGTGYRSQAQRVASFWARALCDSSIKGEMTSGIKSYHVLPGDPVKVTLDTPGWFEVQFLVQRKQEFIEGRIGDLLQCRIYSPDWYSDTDHSPLPLPLPSPRVNPFAVPPLVAAVSLVQHVLRRADGSSYVAVRGSVTFVEFQRPQLGRLYFKGPTDSDYSSTSITITPDPSTMLGVFDFQSISSGMHYFKVVTQSDLGMSGEVDDAVEYSIDVLPRPILPLVPHFIEVAIRAAFVRSPTDAERRDWTDAFAQALDLDEVYDIAKVLIYPIFYTAEYIARARSNFDFVWDLYAAYLHRLPDGGIYAWVALLDGGTSRADVGIGFRDSPEFELITANLSDDPYSDPNRPGLCNPPTVSQVDGQDVWLVQWPYPNAHGVSLSSVQVQIRKTSDLTVVWGDIKLGVVTQTTWPMATFDCKVRCRWRNTFRRDSSDGWSDWSVETDAAGISNPTPPPAAGGSAPVENDPADSRTRFLPL